MEDRILHSADIAPLAWAGDAALHETATVSIAASENAAHHEIAFVDASLPDAASLIADLQAQRSAGRPIEVVTIEAGQDGVALIGATLADRHDIDAVHVLAHGSDGVLQLGSARLDDASLMQRAAEVAGWSASLASSADLMLYGCDLAQTAVGQQLLQDLAALTGADIAASTDVTGAAAAGGDWTLEYQRGRIETPVAPSLAEQALWQGTLSTYTVTNTFDAVGGFVSGSLRWAINQANAHAGVDTINFAVNGTFSIAALTSGDDNNFAGDLDITDSVNIVGNGSALTVINGNGFDRVFDVRNGTVNLSGLTVQGGKSNAGAGLQIDKAAVATLTDVVVQNNVGKGDSQGAGIYVDGDLTLRRVIVRNNGNATSGDTDGAGIYVRKDATLDAKDVEIRDNIAADDRDGGGLYLRESSSVVLENVTIAGNQAKRGGGLWSTGDGARLINVTVSGNSATSEGGGIWSDKGLSLDHVTVANNTAQSGKGGGMFDKKGDSTVTNSLFALNTGGNTSQALNSLGHNLSDDASAGFTATGDRKNTPAGLLALGANGGFTRTQAIGATSAARDAANPVTTLTTDQRGTAYFAGRADIGAYEYSAGNSAPTIASVADQAIDEDTTLAPITFTIGDFETAAGSLTVSASSSNTVLIPNAALVLAGSGSSRTIGLTPSANANSGNSGGNAVITLSVSDGTTTTSKTFTVGVRAVNDAPVLTLPAAQTVGEDATLTLGGVNAPRVDDVDAGSASIQVTLAAGNGSLSLSQSTGLSFVSGGAVSSTGVTFLGSQSNVNAALAGLQYRAGADYNGTDRIDITVSDLGSSGSGGAKSSSGSIGITVGAVNDAPTLAMPGPQVTPIGTPLNFSTANGNAIRLADIDAGTSALALSLSTAATNTLSFGDSSHVVSGNGTNAVTLLGTQAELAAALETLAFSSSTAGAARIDLTLNDQGNTGAGGALQATGMVAITVSNDVLPVLTLSRGSMSFAENGAPQALDPALTISDGDDTTLASASVRIAGNFAAAEDVLSFVNVPASMGNIAGSYAAGTLTLVSAGQTATLAEWQAALRSVAYVNVSDAPNTLTRAVTVTVNDGVADGAARSFAINVVAVNDAPVLSGANDLATIAEDMLGDAGTKVSTLIAGHIGDADAGALRGIAVNAVDGSHGTWQFTVDGGAVWTAFGTVSDASARLLAADANTAVRFVPAADWNGSVSPGLGFRAWDRSAGTAGGVADARVNGGTSSFSSASASSAIVVTAVNDAPSLATPIAPQTATQGTPFTFTVPIATFTDIDVGDTLSLGAGLVSGAALPSWLSFDAGTRTFNGTPGNADIGAITVRLMASDGSATAQGDFVLTVANLNDAPTRDRSISNASATEGIAFSFTLPPATFTDADIGDSLSYSATRVSGAALPSWLSFDAATQTFRGTPTNADVGAITLRVTAGDGIATATGDFVLTVANVNDAPTLATAIASQTATQGAAFNFALPASTFTDIDAGDTLGYTATLASGAGLPTWLRFDAATRTFSGTPANVDVGAFTVRVTASDASTSATGDFVLTVANVNDAPMLNGVIADQFATRGTPFVFALPSASFTDIDAGDTLGYSAALNSGAALPTWLRFDAATQTFSGTPGSADVGSIGLRISASDGRDSASGSFTLTVAAFNQAPVLALPIANQQATQDRPFSFTLAPASFTDADAGDTLRYGVALTSGAALPAWLRFDAASQTFSGTPGAGDVGSIGVRITASDTSASASGVFVVTVNPLNDAHVNDAPVLSRPIADQSTKQGEAFAFTVPAATFTDTDAGDRLSFSATLASGAALPSWLRFDAGTQAFSGTPGRADVGAVGVRITASDGIASASGVFVLTVTSVNAAPTLSLPIANQTSTQGNAFSFTLPAGTFADADPGDRLSFGATLASGAALPTWLRFDSATQTFSGTPANADVGSIDLRVSASDGNASVTGTFALTVVNVDDAPTLAVPIADQSTKQGDTFSFTLAPGTFADADPGDRLSFGATLASGAALPTWLRFDSATQTFSGTPANADVGSIDLRVSATDGIASVTGTFALTVVNVNDAPTLAVPIADQRAQAGDALRFQLPPATFTDADAGDTLHYAATSADGSSLPAWLVFDARSLTFTASPEATVSGSFVIRMTATDDAGAAVRTAFALVVVPAPVVETVKPIDVLAAPAAVPAAAVASTPVAAPAPVKEALSAAGLGTVDQPMPYTVPTAPPAAGVIAPAPVAEAVAAGVRRDAPEVSITPVSHVSARQDPVLATVATPEYKEVALTSMLQLLHSGNLTHKLEEIQRHFLEVATERQAMVAGTIAATGGLSIGYVVWLVRGGVLVSSMLSALPAWQMIDPLPIVAAAHAGRTRRGKAQGEDADLERLFDEPGDPPSAPIAVTTPHAPTDRAHAPQKARS